MTDPDGTRHFEVYQEYAKVLRAWLIAFGIGGPVVLLTQDSVRQPVVDSGQAPYIVRLFLAGVALQVVLALINKVTNWYVYDARSHGQSSCWHSLCERVSNWFFIDVVVDLATVILFAISAIKVLYVFI